MFHDVLIDNLWISCKKGGQDKSSWAATSASFRESSKWWTKIHTRLTWVSRERRKSFNNFIDSLHIWLIEDKLFSNAVYAAKTQKNA